MSSKLFVSIPKTLEECFGDAIYMFAYMFAHGRPATPMRVYTARGLTAKNITFLKREQLTN